MPSIDCGGGGGVGGTQAEQLKALVEGSSMPPSHHSSIGNIVSDDDDAIHVPQNQRTPPPPPRAKSRLRFKPKHRLALLRRIRRGLSLCRCVSLFLSLPVSFSLQGMHALGAFSPPLLARFAVCRLRHSWSVYATSYRRRRRSI